MKILHAVREEAPQGEPTEYLVLLADGQDESEWRNWYELSEDESGFEDFEFRVFTYSGTWDIELPLATILAVAG